jgi:hypothetical protein
MGINISQFSPPATVSNLVWDDDMAAGAGKIFKGDLAGNVTGNVTGDVTGDVAGNITNGGVNGYLLRSGVVSASSGALIVPAGSSTGNTPVTITLNGNGTYCIKDNTQKCYYPSPCTIPVSRSTPTSGHYYNDDAYARSYDADGVIIDSVGISGNLNIYGASYIILNGGTAYPDPVENTTMSVANAYIDADTTVIPGMIAPPTTEVFTGDVVGNVTGNVVGNVTGNVSGKIIVNGCAWGNASGDGSVLQEYGYVPLLAKASVSSSNTATAIVNRYISYPYLGCIDFQPKPTSSALMFTVVLGGPAQGEDIGGQLDVYGANGVTVLRTYRKDNAIGTFTFPVDLTDAYKLAITSLGHADAPVTSSINSLYVKLPYTDSLVD